MIEGVTLTTYVRNHEDKARSLIMALVDAIHFYKTKKAKTLAVIKKHCSELLKMRNDEEWECFYNTQAASLEAKPYSTPDAILNVFALAVKKRSGDQELQSPSAPGPSLSAADRRQRVYPSALRVNNG
jgi:hypothetical protein